MIRVLDDVPQLTRHLDGDDLDDARRAALAVGQQLAPGPWAPGHVLKGVMGAIVGKGLLVRESAFAGAPATQLLGPGDIILQPATRGASLAAFTTAWHVLEPTTMLWLGPTFERAAHRWPALSRSVLALAQQGIERGAAYQAIARLQRVDDRLIALLWHLAERWGSPTAEGIVIPLRLTHRVLGELIGARRPSVTTALGQLAAQGRVERHQDGWMLRGAVPRLMPDLDFEVCPSTDGSSASRDGRTNGATDGGGISARALLPAPAAMPRSPSR